jgi:predicted membrane protein DUF2306
VNPLTFAAFALHIGGGGIALLSGWAALFAPKGGWWHRRAGNIFFASMIVMAVAADWLAVVQPGQTVNLFIGTFTLYLIATAWLTVWRPDGAIGLAEKIAFGVIALLCAPFAVLSFQLATGLPPFFKSAVAFEGPVLIAIYGFTAVTVIATVADAKVVLAGGIAGRPRIARHLWRMCLGLTLATGSAFTNGFARFLPGYPHVPAAFFFPQLVPLVFLAFWMIRVRLTGWYKTEGPA